MAKLVSPTAVAGRDYQPLFDPRSVVVFGASDDRSKWGWAVAERLVRSESRRPVFMVSRGKTEILGRPAYRSIAELPHVPDMAVLVVPAAALEPVVIDVVSAGVRAVVVLSAGLGEAGDEGRAVEARIAATVRDAGAMLLGPNCIGLLDSSTGLEAAAWLDLPAGDVAVVSQSGNIALDIGVRARELGFGFSRFVSLGNQADITAADVLGDCVSHQATKVVAVYGEGFTDGRAFATAAAALVEMGKHVILLSPVGTEASSRAALSHTGSLVTDAGVLDAACSAAGIIRVATPRQMAEAIAGVRLLPSPRTRSVGIVTTGGGNGVIAANVASLAGLDVPSLSPEVQHHIRAAVPEIASSANPVDLIGSTLDDPACLARAGRLMLESGEVDSVIITGSPLAMWEGLNDELASREPATVDLYRGLITEFAAPVIINTDRPWTAAAQAGTAAGLVLHRDIESSVATLVGLCQAASPGGVPATAPPQPPVAIEGYWQARWLIASLGITVAAGECVTNAVDGLAAAGRIGFPVALKALDQSHKSDRGGVILGIGSEIEFTDAFAQMQRTISADSYAVESMVSAPGGVELIVGCKHDSSFGSIVMVGFGGVLAEAVDDVCVTLGPVDREAALRLLHKMRSASLFGAFRGRLPLDLAATADVIATLSGFAAQHPEIQELELNPLLVGVDGVTALDARMVSGQAVTS